MEDHCCLTFSEAAMNRIGVYTKKSRLKSLLLLFYCDVDTLNADRGERPKN